MIVRPIKNNEFQKSQELVKRVFEKAEFSDHEEVLIGKLRQETQYIPELDIVAVEDDELIGYVMLSTIQIGDYAKALCLGPIAVADDHQGMGIGAELIKYAENMATDLGFEAIHIMGYPEYYGRFGYEKASKFDISVDYPVEDKYFLIKELEPGALSEVKGLIEYQKSFGI
ncbi:N-acetyltransferase [Lactobacillus sp. YT155]|uniref:GNAT family N-acetyltransferase n=1 Tax=Lactobacillus sp. YT155 TaxID=3060955 RepID=UPI00265FBB99|nr:N-acetyltransferase [Lactobacillus sp. YT155]MDO1604730.1 N-acetyltransferase [Lactobacillus sp. YT155]